MRFAISALALFMFWQLGRASATDEGLTDFVARIDQHIAARLAKEGVMPAPTVDDGEFIRRVTLDLAGRIPTVAERDAYLQSTNVDRKQELVQRLLDSPDFVFQQRDQLDILLLQRDEYNEGWREYLLEATRANRPWDQLFRETMLPEEYAANDTRPVAFLKRRTSDLDAMTNDTSVLWFGVNISCAKCHDHPLVKDWTQAHYYGMAAFFKRTYQTRKGFLGERFDGVPKYTDIGGKEHEAGLMFLTGQKFDLPPIESEGEALKKLQEQIKKAEQDEKADAPPRPAFRPRAKLVEAAQLETQQRYFARNIANRLWARFLGRGLVHPLDQMHSHNPPSHPELLNELTLELTQSGYDLRRLIQAIVLTGSYSQSIRHTAASSLAPEWFAVAVPRALTPRQLSLSLQVAGANPTKLTGLQGEDWTAKREQLERQADGLARQLAIPDEDFQVPVTEALWFSNNNRVEEGLLNSSGDRVIGYLKEMSDDHQAVQAATRCVLSREPMEEEQQAMVEYLASRNDRRESALKQIVWALVSSPEFRFNH
jgi:hypothetical protein